MTIPSLCLLATAVTAYYFNSDPRYYASHVKPVPVAEGVTCVLTYSPSRIFFLFQGKGEPSGRFLVQVRPGVRNCAAPLAPIICTFENKYGAGARSLVAKAANTRLTPQQGAGVEVKAAKNGGGWDAAVTVPFRFRTAWWPFPVGKKRAPNWQAVVTYTDAAGKSTDWGTVSDPLTIGWGRAPTPKETRDGLFKDFDLVEAYRPARAKYIDLYNHSQVERWIGYLDPGVETFAWRQADSEKLFYERCALPIARECDGSLALLEFQPNNEKKTRDGCRYWKDPKALALSDPAKEKLFEKIDVLNYADAAFAEARKKYLQDRFMQREIPLPAAESVKPKKKASAAAHTRAPDADVDDDGPISLDDAEMEF